MKKGLAEVTIHEAYSILDEYWPTPQQETVTLSESLGRTLAADVQALLNTPPFDAAAMDGYAVRLEDVRTPLSALRVIEELPAGRNCETQIEPGEAVRLFTGSMVPSGADHILIQEHARQEDDQVFVTSAQVQSRHIRKMGGDFRAGDIVLRKGELVTPSHVGLAASSNNAVLPVVVKPRFAILTCGNELRLPGETPKRGEIIESNSYAISSMLQANAAEVERLDPARDDVADLLSKFASAASAQIILAVGGASVGKHDYVKSAFKDLGGDILFEKIAVRPGKPTWLGMLGNQIVLGLPGNPTAVYVIASLLLKSRLSGATGIRFKSARLCSDLSKNGPKETYTRARLEFVDGIACVVALRDQDTSRVKVLTSTNCLIRRDAEDPSRPTGDLVDIVSL